MALEIKGMERVFKFKGKNLPDPDEDFTIGQVIDFYSNQFPEINNANVIGPKMEDDTAVYEIGSVVGDKG